MNAQECINEIEKELGWSYAAKPIAIKKRPKPDGVVQKKQLLDLLQSGPSLSVDIAEKMGVKPKTINHYTRQLERLGCIKFESAECNFKKLHFVTYENYDKEPPSYEKRKKVIKQTKLPELPFSPFLSRMMGYTDQPVANGHVYENLEKPFKAEPLRKINTAWMGYQSGLELA